MKQNGKMLILVILSMISGIGLSYALNLTQTIDNTVAYIQKMVFTTDGTDNTAEKLVIDGSHGSITMSGALNIQEGALKDNTVVSADIKDGEVKGVDLANGAVTNSKIGGNTITSDKIADNTITMNKLKVDGDLDMKGYKVVNLSVPEPKNGSDVVTLDYLKQYFAKHTAKPAVPAKPAVNGKCGSANGGTYTSVPGGSARCSVGSESSFRTSGSRFYWYCNGSNGGTRASCYANVKPNYVTVCNRSNLNKKNKAGQTCKQTKQLSDRDSTSRHTKDLVYYDTLEEQRDHAGRYQVNKYLAYDYDLRVCQKKYCNWKLAYTRGYVTVYKFQ